MCGYLNSVKMQGELSIRKGPGDVKSSQVIESVLVPGPGLRAPQILLIGSLPQPSEMQSTTPHFIHVEIEKLSTMSPE